MNIALSTNWCNRTLENGREIVEKAKALGFDALELGFRTTEAQAREIVEAAILPVGSVHAFCPVPISAPEGYPELYQLASFDEEARAMARFQIKKNIAFAAQVGAQALVLHAGRVLCNCFFKFNRLKKRRRLGLKMVEIFKRELELIAPELEKYKVTLGLENLPYLEGFPDATEIASVVGDHVRPWFDTGHWFALGGEQKTLPIGPIGVHINDSVGGDDHLPPGEGKIDFAALLPTILEAKHVVFEPHAGVTEEALAEGLKKFKAIIKNQIKP